MIGGVPAEPIWRLVEARRCRYGLSWGEISAWLGGWALPVPWQAEIPVEEARVILERLSHGYVATRGTSVATHHQRKVERQLHYYSTLKAPKDLPA